MEIEYHAAGPLNRFQPGRGRALKLGGREVAVFRVGDRVFALENRCPHMGAALSQGRIAGQTVRCPWHGWTFDLVSGRHVSKDWACVPTFPVEIRGDVVYVGIERRRGDGAPKAEQP